MAVVALAVPVGVGVFKLAKKFLNAADSLGDVGKASKVARNADAAQAIGKANGVGELPADVATSFEGGKHTKITLKDDLTVRRYFGGSSPKEGRWFTSDYYATRKSAIDALSLPPGNAADSVVQSTIRKGTTVYVGKAAPMFGRAGGGSQLFVFDKHIPRYGTVLPVPGP